MNKRLSIIIPLYNVRDYVDRTAKSIASQWTKDIEVIVIDDGSIDDSLDVCISHLPDIEVIKIIQENKGLSAARNAGIRAATGEYLLFLDGDDFLLPGAIRNILSLLEIDSPDVIYGRFLLWDFKRGFTPARPYEYNPPEDAKKRTEYILGNPSQPSWNAWRYITRRSFITQNNLFFIDGILSEDVPWTLTVLEAAGPISFLKEPFYAYYHSRPLSIMRSRNPKRLIDLNNSVANLVKQYKDRPVVCTQLVWQSFLFIYEYCLFKQTERNEIYNSYRAVLPKYNHSDVRLHRITSKCNNPLLLYVLSVGMLILRQMRRILVGVRRFPWRPKINTTSGY
ncbi:MAG: glycosyltransferase [Defluviitaleaceae bacterium]|nr:glycosyltransferase [Defluviitaleaceae bacterium]